MENNNLQAEPFFQEKNNYFNKNQTYFTNIRNINEENNRYIKKNIFLSLPKLENRDNRINRTFLQALNLTMNNQRNKTIDTLYSYNNTKYENRTKTMPNKAKKNLINVTIIEKKNKYNLPRNNNRFTLIVENSKSNKIHQNSMGTNFNTYFKNQFNKNIKSINISEAKRSKSIDQNISKTQNFNPLAKKPSIDYITPIFKNMKIFKMREEPNLKLLSVGDLMHRIIHKSNINNNNITCMLNNENKNGIKLRGINLKTYFKVGGKFSSVEKVKDLDKRNEYYSKIKILNDENKDNKENKFKKRIIPMRNCHDLLKYYKDNRFENFRKLIQKTLLDVRKEKNSIIEFFDNYKKVFDEYDDWNDPKNKDNLYSK